MSGIIYCKMVGCQKGERRGVIRLLRIALSRLAMLRQFRPSFQITIKVFAELLPFCDQFLDQNVVTGIIRHLFFDGGLACFCRGDAGFQFFKFAFFFEGQFSFLAGTFNWCSGCGNGFFFCGNFYLFGCGGFPFANFQICRLVAGILTNVAVAFEAKNFVYGAIQKIAVVADDN